MFSELMPAATLPVKDLAVARRFYEGTLGLKVLREEMEGGGLFYSCGDGMLFVYVSGFAGTNKATAVTFGVDDAKFDAEIDALREKGVSFMTFEYEGITWKDDVAITDGMRGVWFADPDGNIINVGSLPT
ncbi:glyoxalase [Longispora fulva]|uniref:Catechol 2,3-dioxygenase-like lactoylglutathione lyase family enzyme n=1 Tax=Longispora fulva TaxID=619741 RepID=A0A8J7GIV6_9ACTN|nr:VOC family protein [Longispora fulva]MBG6138911.1 catechol 2,3-dioxygenase-like lactoylglutathione lyase family enzyme [Longispora fulva]GIG58404.1 glyoxalase [Longispora fulva]